MKHVILPPDLADHHKHSPFFHLALEEWLACHAPKDDNYFFSWVITPTVVIGRNQELSTEVNVPYCREHGIHLCRRRSGGGAIYADEGNMMFSMVTSAATVEDTFGQFLGIMTEMLRSLGLDAAATGRNDITIGEGKVSGCACYRLPGASIVHGTMLHTVRADLMERILTPPKEKLSRHGIASVSSRVTCVSHHIDITAAELRAYALARITDAEYHLSAHQLSAVLELMKRYEDERWVTTGYDHRTL